MKLDKKTLKDTKHHYRTQSMFIEFAVDKYPAYYTILDQDKVVGGKVYKSFKQLYLEIADPTEWEVATTLFGGWDQWDAVVNSYKIGPLVEKCREELEIKLRSKAVRALIQTAETEGSKGSVAAKYIAEGRWKGRKQNTTKTDNKVEAAIKEDAARLKAV